jgi:PPOX class probable F420-dependent enzyme
MPTQEELWQIIAGSRHGTLATVGRDGAPQLSNILYVTDAAARLVRISTTADRVKARNLTRDARAALYVVGEDFWHYAVGSGTATLSAVAATPGDPAASELADLHAAFYGSVDRPAFDEDMIANKRLVVRLGISRLSGVIAPAARRPVRPDGSAGSGR